MDTRPGFHQSLKELERDLLQMGTGVEQAIRGAVESLASTDEKQAKQIIAADDHIDSMMLQIEERCLRLLALQQPMASDLRLIGMALKITTDLERIADHAVDIAKATLRIAGEQLVKPLVDIPRMADISMRMLQDSLQAYARRDVQLAAGLASREDEVDKLYSTILRDVIALMGAEAGVNRQLTHLLMAAHDLERVADHATNIGEGVIYMVTGKRKDLNV
jgi:phosphate transport system protein